MQCKASSFMPINPSTDPAVYNTGSLKCIRAGLPAFSSLSSILFLLLVGDLAPLAVATLSPCCSTPHWPLYSLANTPKWNGLHAPPQHTIYHLPHASLVSFLHPLLAWFCTPPPAVISPLSCSQSPHRSRPLSPPLLYPLTKVVDCWITLEPGGGRPTDCKERDNWSFSLIGFPDKQHPGWECADRHERQKAVETEYTGSTRRSIFIYIYGWREGKLYKEASERRSVDSGWL